MTRKLKSATPLPPGVRDDLVEILAEILVQDYQAHRMNTVGSPPLTNRKFLGESLGTSQTDLLDSA